MMSRPNRNILIEKGKIQEMKDSFSWIKRNVQNQGTNEISFENIAYTQRPRTQLAIRSANEEAYCASDCPQKGLADAFLASRRIKDNLPEIT